MELGLAGRRALVTGSYRGTGSAIAESLAAEGVEVLVHGFEPGQADEVVERLVASGGEARAVVGDLLTDDGVDELIEQTGVDLDIAVCNYGLASGGRWTTATTDDWLDSYNKNVLSVVRVANALVQPLAARGWGRIVLLGTIGTDSPAAKRPQYYAAKGALPIMTQSLAKELAGSGVTVNLVSPGLITTPEVLERLGDRSVEEAYGLSNLTGRPAEPGQVADLVTFLCSEQAGAINGANYRIDGGGA